jgi:serine protease Do
MKAWKFVTVAILIFCLVGAGLGLSCASKATNEANGALGPINPSWDPVYIDDQVESPLDKADLVKEISPVVVSITTETLAYNVFLQPAPQSGAATGVIIDPKGYIVTNNHVVDGVDSLKVTLNDGRTFDAIKWAGDSATDLAVVQIQAGGDLPYARFLSRSLEKLQLLEDVVAVGNALALPGGPTWTEGVVSYLGRSIQESNGVVLDKLIQTDTAINPGNSGGPLVNMAGQVVGISTAIASGAENIGFAISTDTAVSTVYSLVTKGSGSG